MPKSARVQGKLIGVTADHARRQGEAEDPTVVAITCYVLRLAQQQQQQESPQGPGTRGRRGILSNMAGMLAGLGLRVWRAVKGQGAQAIRCVVMARQAMDTKCCPRDVCVSSEGVFDGGCCLRDPANCLTFFSGPAASTGGRGAVILLPPCLHTSPQARLVWLPITVFPQPGQCAAWRTHGEWGHWQCIPVSGCRDVGYCLSRTA